jgi:hypothetical protein
VVDNFNKDNFPFGKKFRFPIASELKNAGKKTNLNSVWILKGFKPFGKNLINSPKFFLGMIFNTMNLDWLTCIQNFEVPLQVENGLKRNIKKEFKFEFETHLN